MENLKEIMSDRGVTIKALSEQMGVSPTTIARYRNGTGKDIRIDYAKEIAAILDVSLGELFGTEAYDQTTSMRKLIEQLIEEQQKKLDLLLVEQRKAKQTIESLEGELNGIKR